MSKSRLFSGKIKKLSGDRLTADRYDYLDVSQAEPDLGLPLADNAILTANTSGQRIWSQTITNITLAGTIISSGTVTGDLLPSITDAFNLGSADLRFKTLYVSSATLDIGGVTLSSSGNDSLNVSKLIITTSTNSDSTTTGALQVIGGVGIGGNLYVGGEIVADKLTIQYTTITTTLIQTDDVFNIQNETASNSTDTGALTVVGGVGIGSDLQVGGQIYRNGIAIGYAYDGSRGYDGSQGDVGYTGSQGDVGYAGSQGDVGYTGSAGSDGTIGYNGSQGDVGYTGSQGDVGYTGSAGSAGSDGTIGYNGSQGDVGYTGSKGESSFTWGTTPPSSPEVGDRWYDTNKSKLVVYVDDGDSFQWVETAASGFLGRTGYTGSAGTGGGGGASSAASVGYSLVFGG